MNAKKTPLQQVNEEHGGKAKLVDKLVGLLDHAESSDDKDSVKARLLAASNHKLLHLLQVSEKVRSKYGSAEKLTEAVAGALGRAKDSDYVKKLAEYSPARLLDMAGSLARRAKHVGEKTTARAKDAVAKASTAAKGAAAKAKETAAKAKAKASRKK